MSDHKRLVVIHQMLDPEGTSLKSIEELIGDLQTRVKNAPTEALRGEARCPMCGAPTLLGPYR